jgi:hypothetical protein
MWQRVDYFRHTVQSITPGISMIIYDSYPSVNFLIKVPLCDMPQCRA